MGKENSNFTCTEVFEKEVVLIAGGKLGPLKDCVVKNLKSSSDQDIRLFFGADTQRDLNGADELQKLSAFPNNFHMVTALNSPNPEWEGEVGLITDVVRDQLNPEKVKKCFLYGTREMVDETKRTIKKMGVPEEKIHQNSFTRDY